jgi:vacuolar-type H+-ATPase subunit F/Vma7
MSKIIILGDHDMALGFSLIGLRDCVTTDAQNAEAELDKALARPDAGMIILLEDFVPPLSHKMRRRIEASSKPVVVTVPGKSGATRASGNLQALIKRAIGIELKN